jgi:hypothetical protein
MKIFRFSFLNVSNLSLLKEDRNEQMGYNISGGICNFHRAHNLFVYLPV